MILESAGFTFKPPPQVRWARRILIKPYAAYDLPYPVTTSPESLEVVIAGIRKVSEADIIILEGNPKQESMRPIYKSLGYNFPRVLTLDVKDSIFVEVENPLTRPFVVSTFWLPNVLLYCDYLITMSPFKLLDKRGNFSIENLLGLLPVSKYLGDQGEGLGALHSLGIDKVIADLYFTLPFDLGIIDAGKRFIGTADFNEGSADDYGKMFVGEPYQVDYEASQSIGIEDEYLQLIEMARVQLAKNGV